MSVARKIKTSQPAASKTKKPNSAVGMAAATDRFVKDLLVRGDAQQLVIVPVRLPAGDRAAWENAEKHVHSPGNRSVGSVENFLLDCCLDVEM